MPRIRLGFRSKIYLGTLSLVLLMGIVILIVVTKIMRDSLLEETRNRAVSIGLNLTARTEDPILAMDLLRMKTLVDETVQMSDDIFYSFILDEKGEPLVHTFKWGFPVDLKKANQVPDNVKSSIRFLDTGSRYIDDYAFPILIEERRFGTVRLGLLRTKMDTAMSRLFNSTVLSIGLVILLAALVGTGLALPVTKRIRILHESSNQVIRGNLDVHTAPPLKHNCWEIMACGETGCPAYENYDIRCWHQEGTRCPQFKNETPTDKMAICQQCQVYRKCSGDEIQSLAESFDSMALSLKTYIAQLRDTQATLWEQRQRLKTVLDATPDYVFFQDNESRYLAANKAFCEMVGKSEEELIGRTDFDLFPKRWAARFLDEDQGIIKTRKPLIREGRIKGAGGSRRLHIVKTPVYDADRNVAGLLCSCRDITEFKRVQDRATQAQKMEAIGQLTAGVAHEINTPLGIILGYAQLLLEDVEAGSQIHEDLKTIEKHAKICRKIVSDLLRFSRHTESTMGPLDINETIEDVLSVAEHTFNLERVSLARRYDPGLPPIEGDKEKIKQVVINLANNAFDAIGKDGVITVSTHYDPAGNEVVIRVTDNGIGIPPESQGRIFDPFFTTKPAGKGTGLGLSVTFGIVKEHGGKIEVESPLKPEEGQGDQEGGPGTAFMIHLPASKETDEKESVNGKDTGSG